MTQFFPIGELIDRYCIAQLKYQRTQKNLEEFQYYSEQITAFDIAKIDKEIKELYDVHCEIWDLESLLKSGLEQHVELAVIGQRAIDIRNLNNRRIVIKNRIAEIFGCAVREIKQDHISQ